MSDNFISGHLNIRSLLPKINDLRDIVNSHRFDILALSETWLSRDVRDADVSIPGYNIVRKDRVSRGGGVCFYVATYLKFKIVESSDDIEQLWISVEMKRNSNIFGVIYRPPVLDHKYFLDKIEESVFACSVQSDNIIVMGDVNIDMLNIGASSTKHFESVLDAIGLKQIVNKPTRITNLTETLLDVILVSDSSLVKMCDNLDVDLSDHELTYCILKFDTKVVPHFITYRPLNKINLINFVNDLEQLSLQNIYLIEDVSNKVEYLNNCLLGLFDFYAPYKTIKISKPYKPWLTHNIRTMIKLRNKAKLKFKKSKSTAHWDEYKQLRNLTEVSIKNEKKAYFNYKLNTRNSKVVWKELSGLNIKKRSPALPACLRDPNVINNYFIESIPSSSSTDELLNYYKSSTWKNFTPNFEFELVNDTIILQIINGIATDAVGADGISSKMLKLCCPFVVPFISHIINTSLILNTFPKQWKEAYVIPVPKVPNPVLLKHLRPISILPAMSKILERVMHQQLTKYLNVCDILPANQSGFRKSHSTTTALMQVSDDILEATDTNKITALILLDLTKAFDTLDHKLLIAKLGYIGLGDGVRDMLLSYLNNRTQRVKIDNDLSKTITLNVGVPQGSILGPLLFNIYTFDIYNKLEHCRAHMYADDCQVYYSFEKESQANATAKITSDLDIINENLKGHSLILNPDKSRLLLFGNKVVVGQIRDSINITVNSVRIAVVESAKNLGIEFDISFRFRTYVSRLVRRSYAALRLLYPHRSYLSTRVKSQLCESLVLSVFLYCAPMYYPCLDQECRRRIQVVQNSCIRYIFGIRRSDHVSHKLGELNWLSMENKLKLRTLCQYHQILSTKTPPYLYDKIRFRTDVHNINIRKKTLITPPLHKTAMYERSFSFNVARLYNNVPVNLKDRDLKIFKVKMSVILSCENDK